MPPAAPIEGDIWNDANYNGLRDEGEKGIAGVQIRITKWYLDPADHSGGTDGTWKRAYLINEKGEQVLEPVTTCVTSDGKPGLRLRWRDGGAGSAAGPLQERGCAYALQQAR